VSALSRLIARHQAERANAAKTAARPDMSSADLARRISWILDEASRAEARMPPLDRARLLVADMLAGAGELIEDPDAARYLTRAFGEAAAAIREDVAPA
jgi:hypothetical protein